MKRSDALFLAALVLTSPRMSDWLAIALGLVLVVIGYWRGGRGE